MEGFGHLGNGGQPILPPTSGPSFYRPTLRHLPQPHFSDPHYAFAIRPPPPQENNWLHTNPPTSARYLFPSPSPSPGPNPIHPSGIPPSNAYGQSMTNFLISRHHQPRYPSTLIQDSSTSLGVNEHGNVLSRSGFLSTAPVGCFSNGGNQGKQKNVNVGSPPSNASRVNQDFSIASIQQQLSGIEPLNESNYMKWRSQIDIILCHLEYDVALLEPKPDLPVDTAPESVKEKYQKWTKANRMCIMIIRGSLSEIIRGEIPDTDSAKELMDIIQIHLVRSRKSSIGTTISQLCTMTFDGQGSVREHILQMAGLVCRLRDLKMEINDDFLVHMTLNSLPEGFNTVKVNYYSTEEEWDANELITHCVQEEVRHREEKVGFSSMQTSGAKKESFEKSEMEKVNVGQRATKLHVENDCPNNNGKKVQDHQGQPQQPQWKRQNTEAPTTADPRQRDGADRVKFTGCYRCGEDGHIASACPDPKRKKRPLQDQDQAQQSDQLVQCYCCSDFGHYARDCPKKRRPRKNKGEQNDRVGEHAQQQPVQSQGQMNVLVSPDP